MSIEMLERRWKAKRPPAEQAPEPAPGSLDAALDALVRERVAAELERQDADRPQRRRHIPSYAQDFDQGFTSSPQPSPASAPVTPNGDFSAVLEKNEVGRTVAITATSHGKRQRFVVQRDSHGRAVGMRLEGDAHEPLPPVLEEN